MLASISRSDSPFKEEWMLSQYFFITPLNFAAFHHDQGNRIINSIENTNTHTHTLYIRYCIMLLDLSMPPLNCSA